MNGRRLTEEQIIQVCRRYVEGQENLSQLGRDFGVSATSIAKHLKRRGVKRPNVDCHRPKLNEEQIAEVCRRYVERQQNISQLARTFGVDPMTIAKYLKREGVKRPSKHGGRSKLTEGQIAEVCRRYVEEREKLAQLGRDFGVDPMTIAKYLKREGVKRPNERGVKPKLNEEQVAEVCRRYVEGREDLPQLGGAFGVSRSTIARYLKLRGIDIRPNKGSKPKLNEEQVAEVCRRYVEGREDLSQLGRDFGVDPGTIASYLKREGVKRPNERGVKPKLNEGQIAEVCRRYAEGREDLSQLGGAFGVSRSTIARYLNLQGIDIRPNKGSKPKLNEEQIAEVCRRYAEGREDLSQLGRDFGVNPGTIASYLKKEGVKRPDNIGPKPKLSEEQVAEVCRRYVERREDLAQLGGAFGVSRSTIARYLKLCGIDIRPNKGGRPKLNEEQVAEVCRRYTEERENLAQLARAFGVDSGTIASYLKKEGVKRPSKYAGIIRLTEGQIAEVCRRYAEGQDNLAQLGRDFGASSATIANHLKSRGVKRPGRIGGRPKLNEEQVAEVCLRYAEGREDLAQLGRDFGVKPGTIASYLKREGVKQPGKHAGSARLSKAQIAEVCRRYAEGRENLAQLGRDFGVSEKTIANHLKSRGVKRPGRSGHLFKLTEGQIAEVCRRHVEEQEGIAQLARAFGVSDKIIDTHLKNRGVKRPGRSGYLFKLTEEQIAEVCRRYVEERENFAELARAFGVSATTIAKYLKIQGIDMQSGERRGRKSILTEEQVAEVCRRYVEEDESQSQLAKAFGVSQNTIANRLKSRGVKRLSQSPRLKLKAEQIAEICSRYISGEPINELAKAFAVSPPTIMKYLKISGVELPKKSMLDEQQTAEMCRRYEGGDSIDGLAKSYRISPRKIKHFLKTAGTKLRRRIESFGRWLKRDEWIEVCRRYEEGEDIGQLAEYFKASPQTIRRHLKAGSVTLREADRANEAAETA